MGSQNVQSAVSGSAVASAGLASALAALVTSRFGVAGTLIGAALTTMIITGGSAILKSYLENVTGRVRKVPGKVRARSGRSRNEQGAGQQTIPARPDLLNNFMGRLRASFDWFSHLPPLRRRAILVGAVVPAVIAFIISMGAVTSLELAIGNSLPCGIWNNCPRVADGSSATTTPPSLLRLAGQKTSTTQNQQLPGSQQQVPGFQQVPGSQQQLPEQQNGQQDVDPNAQPLDPQQPVTPDPATPDSGTPVPAEPQVEPAPTPSDPVVPPAEEVPAPLE